MTVKTYDTESYRLANHFLQDEPCRNDPVLYAIHSHRLALCIQQAVEDWFMSPPDDEDCAALPTAEYHGLTENK